jgi:hypothetical protein
MSALVGPIVTGELEHAVLLQNGDGIGQWTAAGSNPAGSWC